MHKLLVIAYACEPGRGSEWGIGWNFVKEMSRTQDVWVVTHADNRAGLDEYLRTKHSGHTVHVRYVKLPFFLGWLRHAGYTLLNLHYYLWQFAAAKAARQLHDETNFDVVQHISFYRWWMPSAGAALAKRGVKFVFGPVGGGDLIPPKFRRHLPFAAKWSDFSRWVARTIWTRDPSLKRCIRAADVVLAGTQRCKEHIAGFGPRRLEVMSGAALGDSAILEIGLAARAARPEQRKFKFISGGGLTYWRGVDLAIKAFAKLNLPDVEYHHVCYGQAQPMLQQLARELGIADRVILHGDRAHSENVKEVATADAMVHTVLRDTQGLVCEALAMGVPVITFAHHTPELLVDESCGHRLKIDDSTTPEQAIDELAKVMRHWYEHPELLKEMGPHAIAKARQFSHAYRGEKFRAMHEELVREKRKADGSLSASCEQVKASPSAIASPNAATKPSAKSSVPARTS